jgi:hypothetical protein
LTADEVLAIFAQSFETVYSMNNTMVNCMLNLDKLLLYNTAKGTEVAKTSLNELCCFAHHCILTHHYDIEYVVGSVFEDVSTSLLKSYKPISRRIRHSMHVIVVIRTLGFKNLSVFFCVYCCLGLLFLVILLFIVFGFDCKTSDLSLNKTV